MGTVDSKVLDNLEIMPWSERAKDFAHADLLLGNGFSLNLADVFGYDSLFDRFLKNSDPNDDRVLRAFNTTNFEFILGDLGIASRVNSLMKLPFAPANELANRVREGLIKTIEQSHPRKASIDWPRLESIAGDLAQFGDIFTLNYDALLYHIIMICKDRWVPGSKSSRYNDYFWKAISPEYLQFMDFQNISPYQHVYYLHGALFLFKVLFPETLLELDVKLRTTDASELLDAIASEIRSGTLPLFVSEGRAEEKQRAIARSDYLRFANEALTEKRERLVIYGASLGRQDKHIADAVRRSTKKAAIALYIGGRDEVALDQEMNRMRVRLPGVKLSFFDSATLFS